MEKTEEVKFFTREKGHWKRFFKLLIKCHIPWVWLAIYIALSLGVVYIGLDITKYTAKLFAGDVSVELVEKLVVVIIVNCLGYAVTGIACSIMKARMNRNVRYSVWKKILHVPISFFEDETPRETVSRITSDSAGLASFFTLVLVPLITDVYAIVESLKIVSEYDGRLMMTIVVMIPLTAIATVIIGRMYYAVMKQYTKLDSKMTAKVSEVIKNIPLIKAFAKEEKERKRSKKVIDRYYRAGVRYSWLDQIYYLTFDVMDVLQIALMVLVGMILFHDGGIDKEGWIAFFLFSGKILGQVSDLSKSWRDAKDIEGETARIAVIMDAPCEESGDKSCQDMKGDIVFDHVTFGYNEEKKVLDDISCVFESGKVTALLGVSGCGKSTTINLIERIFNPLEGKITIGGTDISEFQLHDYRKKFAVISQQPMLFAGSIRENLIFSLEREVTDEEIKEALERADAGFVFELPEGLDSQLNEYGGGLSGGQKQKLAIASALLADTPYLLLDEATTALDAVAAEEVMKVLKEAAKNRTVIAISHSASVLGFADNTMILEKGKIVASGKTSDIYKTNQFLRDFVGKGEA